MTARRGRQELAETMRRSRGLFLAILLFSVFVNLLLLTGPLFMLQVYDRVLASRSEETLVALIVLVAVLYALMGVLDYVRGRIAARIGAAFQSELDARVFGAVLDRAVAVDDRTRPSTALQDLESIQRFLSAPVLFAIFDMPWTPMFIALIFVFHPLLGWVALGGGVLLVTITLLNQWVTRRPQAEATAATSGADSFAHHLRDAAESVAGMGMQAAVLERWRRMRDIGLERQIRAADRTGAFGTLSKTFRFFLQSLILAVGAWLVLEGQIQAGAMIAASILLGRALAPVEQAIAGWPMFQRARLGWGNLTELLNAAPPPAQPLSLPRPRAVLTVEKVTVIPPGERVAALKMLSFELKAGQALGVIGQSAAGKSSLARVLTGVWPVAAGSVRLDGAALDQYARTDLGRHIGYLPQEVVLYGATVAENIARMGEPDAALVVEAAKKAGAHEMILKLPEGYDTRLSPGGGRLSGGQRQRIGLARALYGEPVVVILDEPNSNLDALGSKALNDSIRRIKAAGGAVIIMAHRPSGIAECDLILVLEDGARKAFGPRDEVLRAQVQNYAQIAGAIGTDRPQ